MAVRFFSTKFRSFFLYGLRLGVGVGLAELFLILLVCELDEMSFEPSNVCLAVLMGLHTDEDFVCGLMSSLRDKIHLFLSVEFSLNYIRAKLTFRIPLKLQ